MVGCGVLHNKTLVTVHAFEDMWFFDRPLSNISPILFGLGILFLRMGWGPSGLPVICKLFEERGFESSWLPF